MRWFARLAGYIGLLLLGVQLIVEDYRLTLPKLDIPFWTVAGCGVAVFAVYECIRGIRALQRRPSRWHYHINL